MAQRRAETPGRPLQVRLSEAERRRAEQAAAVNHQTLSDFIRTAVDTAAGDCLEDGTVMQVH